MQNQADYYTRAWKDVADFYESNDFLFEHNIDSTRPLTNHTDKFNKFVCALLKLFKQKERITTPDVLSHALTASCRAIPFSYNLRLYTQHFCHSFPQSTNEELLEIAHRTKNLRKSNYRIALAELFAEIENENVDLISKASYQGIEVWPMLRAALATSIEDKILAPGRFTTRIAGDAEAAVQKIKHSFSNVIGYTAPDIKFLDDDAEFQSGRMNVDFLFFARALRYLKKENGNWVSGAFDQLYQLLARNYACIKIEEYDQKALMRQPRVLAPKYFRTPWDHDKARFLSKTGPVTPPWRGLEEKCSWKLFSSATNILGIDRDKKIYLNLLKNLRYSTGYCSYFSQLLKNINPKFVFQEIYHSPESIGLILACKSLGIPVIEIQHGLIGSHQWQSTHWVQMPELGYLTHPDYFWVFDKFEKENSEALQPQNAFLRPSIVSGHPEIGLLKIKKKKATERPRKTERAFLDGLKDGIYNVLFSLQYHDNDFSTIASVAKTFPDKVRALVRLHPMQLPLLDMIRETIEGFGLSNVEIEYSTKIPLEEFLHSCHHVVTRYSTVAREALENDCDVALTDPMGQILFRQYLDLQRMSYCPSNNDLLYILQNSLKVFSDPVAWQKKKTSFARFRLEYLKGDTMSAVEEMRTDWLNKSQHRQRVIERAREKHLFKKPLDIERCRKLDIIRNVERVGEHFAKRDVFLVDRAIPINRSTLSTLFLLIFKTSNPKSAMDIVFFGKEALQNSSDILQLFHGMSSRTVNVHLDSLGTMDTAPEQENRISISAADFELFRAQKTNDPADTNADRISTSQDTLIQTKDWLAERGFRDSFSVLTLSDEIDLNVIERLLGIQFVRNFAKTEKILVNGAPNLLNFDVTQFHYLELFEPAIYHFGAAASLCECADTNLLISNHASERLFSDRGKRFITKTATEWLSLDTFPSM